MDQRDAILETLRRVLRQTTLRAILRPLGRTPLDVTAEEADALLEPYAQQLETDFVMCREVAEQFAALVTHTPVEQAEPSDTLTLDSEDE